MSSTLSLVLLLCGGILATVHADCTNLDRYVMIKSQKTGLVFVADPILNLITLQEFEQSTANHFQLQTGSKVGRFHIFHRDTGSVLDVVEYPTGGYIATLSPLSDSETQEFHINSRGTIVSAAYPDYALAVRNGEFTPGNFIVLAPLDDNNIESEKFNLEFSEIKHADEPIV